MGVLALAILWDLGLGEPRYLHPVRGVGWVIAQLEKLAPRSGRAWPLAYGLAMALLVPGGVALGSYFLARGLLVLGAIAYLAVEAFLLKSSFAFRELHTAARKVERSLEAGRMEEARQEVKALVSRDTRGLPPELVASATVESVAENTTDSFVAPWLAFAIFGLPGALAYRAVNTLDSMVGYHGRYEHLGKAAARLDDLVNFLPARLSALLLVLAALFRGRDARGAWWRMRQEHGRTESPNAGWTMSAMAGAVGVGLEKVGHYRLGDPGRPPGPTHIRESLALASWVAGLVLVLTLGIMALRYAT